MRLRRPPPPSRGLFARTAAQWTELGHDPDSFPGAPTDPLMTLWALVERSALTPDELAVLGEVAAGRPDPRLPVPAYIASMALDRWHGLTGDLKLMPLPHHIEDVS